jgi:excisionase family DNA binding protein
MESKSFTVKEAASIMGCKKSTIYQLLADGWLGAPEGRPKGGEGVRVSEKSLFQFMILDRLSQVPIRTLKALKNGRKEFEGFFSKNANAKRLYSKGTGEVDGVEVDGTEVDGALSPVDQTAGISLSEANSTSGLRAPTTVHHEFVEQHHFKFRRRARQLAPNDRAFQDDLVQEMALAVLEYHKPASFDFLFNLASDRAVDYCRYEAARGMLPLSDAYEVSDRRAEQRAGLETYIYELQQRGVPQNWIDEVIGYRLEVA